MQENVLWPKHLWCKHKNKCKWMCFGAIAFSNCIINIVSLTLLATAFFSHGCSGGGADFTHDFETPVRASFEILTSFELRPIMTHEWRPRIQKIKCLAQKLTKWRRIEKIQRWKIFGNLSILRLLQFFNPSPFRLFLS